MDAGHEVGYKPPVEFQEDKRDPLIELNLTDSTELWLIQWPIDLPPDINGQEVSLELHRDGCLGSFKGSSGKSYDMVSFAAQDPEATVFLSSSSESKVVGKISRRVSLVHYIEPSEIQQRNAKNLKKMYSRSSGTTLSSSATRTQGNHLRHSRSASGHAASTHDSRHRSSLSGVGEPSKASKRRHGGELTSSMDHSAQDLGQGHTLVISTGSLDHSQEKKSKKKKTES